MFNKIYGLGVRFPKTAVLLGVALTVFFATRLDGLTWETDARVYLPKGHAAIKYDEKVDDVFGVKDAIIIGIVNEKNGVFNPETLARIDRVTRKVAALDGVLAARQVDIASLATATAFIGTESEIGSKPLMEKVPETPAEIEALRTLVYDNADLFVGNIVSADGKAAMIRAKLKEGIANRYMTYFAIKGIVAAESGEVWGGGGWGAGQWNTKAGNQWSGQGGGQWGGAAGTQWGGNASDSPQQEPASDGAAKATTAAPAKSNDTFYLSGRPVIEVSSGLYAMEDIKLMVPLVIAVMAIVLVVIFRTLRGVLLPLFVMGATIVWTLGTMVVLGVPLYTISTMLPVILVAVGIGDAVHLLSEYYGIVLRNPHRPSRDIVAEAMQHLGAPLFTVSATTAIGFLSLLFAEMPPFKTFGIFAAIGILYAWLITIFVMPAILTLLKPKVAGYFEKRRSMRVMAEPSTLAWALTRCGRFVGRQRVAVAAVVALLVVVASYGASSLSVDSSWMSDFKKDSEVARANDMLNDKFDGTIFLNIVIEGKVADTFKNPDLLKKIDALQTYTETLPYVGDSLSVVDYLKSMNKTLHAGDKAYNVLPDSSKQIGEYLFLFAVSGRPQQLDEVVDYDYRRGLVTVMIKTDHTRDLKVIIDAVDGFVQREFSGLGVDVNYAGSANNSYIWADLLIDSQTSSIVSSKLGIFVLAALIFLSLLYGVYVIAPATLSTLLVAGVAGYFAIPLDVSTALAAGMAIGAGVDYAVHYLFRYRDELKRCGGDHDEATAATLRTTGRTVIFNAVVVTVGFAVLFASHFPPHAKLGYFVAAYMIVSCLAALIVLPLLTSLIRPRERAAEGVPGEAQA